MNFDEHNFSLTPKSTDNKNLASSVGNTFQSFIKGDMDSQGLKKSEV
jgi:hypothetical protein